ncbi:MAG: efflux RND transporter periplasmic adaptor subunit [Deltaproteobacteria bacterium]|nr:efflux RND transporter periplasmic adaptor subunit [Deltaproteobacteria bacterium]
MPLRAAVSATFLMFAVSCGKLATDDAGKKEPAAPVKVALVVAAARPTPQVVVLSGIVTADQRAEVSADTAGKVINVMIERGKRVKQGDPVVQLDVRSAALGAREAQANLASARAQRELAEEECRRTKSLLDKGAITRSEFDRQNTACTSALQQVSAAEARTQMMTKSVADGMLRAPFDGVVAEKMVTPGEWVAPGRPLFTLVDDDPLRIELSVPEIGVHAVRADQRVELISIADDDAKYGATVTRIGAEIGRTRSLIIEARIDKDSSFVPGMFAEARVEIGKVPRPVLPRTAVRGKCEQKPKLKIGADGKQEIIQKETCRGPWRAYVVVKGELEERIVQLGPEPEAGKVSIEQGVKPGEKVVAVLDDKIVDGLRVVE